MGFGVGFLGLAVAAAVTAVAIGAGLAGDREIIFWHRIFLGDEFVHNLFAIAFSLLKDLRHLLHGRDRLFGILIHGGQKSRLKRMGRGIAPMRFGFVPAHEQLFHGFA
jgi:hypothetical protein